MWSIPKWCCDKESARQCRRSRRLGFGPWVRKIPWRRKWQPTPVVLPGKSRGQRSLAGCSPGSQRVGQDWAMENWAPCSATLALLVRNHTHIHIWNRLTVAYRKGTVWNHVLKHPAVSQGQQPGGRGSLNNRNSPSTAHRRQSEPGVSTNTLPNSIPLLTQVPPFFLSQPALPVQALCSPDLRVMN